MPLTPHTKEWYDRLAALQPGYYYPWQSILSPGNGEDAYLELVRARLHPQAVVLDAGCGHGEVALALAPFCQLVVAYDRVASYIEMARAAQARGPGNVVFLRHDSSAEANGGTARIPAEPASFDLLISRRGPLNWIEDARRVARPGAWLIQLNPMETPPPPWNAGLPLALQRPDPGGFSILGAVKDRLERSGLSLHSAWTYDVPETLPDTLQLYTWLAWGFDLAEIPPFSSVRPQLERIFSAHAGPHGLLLRHRRLLWQARIAPESG